jgi:hypothetical protein
MIPYPVPCTICQCNHLAMRRIASMTVRLSLDMTPLNIRDGENCHDSNESKTPEVAMRALESLQALSIRHRQSVAAGSGHAPADFPGGR